MHRKLLALAAILAMLATGFEAHAACTAANPNASVAEATPTSAFTDHGNGTVTHNLTGLTWKQCVEGRSGAGCATGAATAMTWSAALSAAATSIFDGGGWRLPNKKELESLVEACGYNPSINQTLFPATPALFFWSGSSYVSNPTKAWFVYFGNGSAGSDVKPGNFYVRLVRGGQSFDSFDAQNDFVPDAFTFTAQTGVALATVATSNTITVAGINTVSPISIASGTYSINGGAYTAAAGTVNNGDTVTLQQTSSGSFSTLTTATLTIGGVAGAFDVTTLAQDTTPNAFTFTAQTGAALSTVATSNTITVAGINSAANIGIAGGTYSKNGGAYTAVAGTVNNGDTVTLKQTSSGSYSTMTTATLTIGGVSGAFNVTTASAPVVEGACGSANGVATAFVPAANLCAAGSASAVTAGSPWTWSCNGSNGGTNASCSAPNQSTGGGSGRAVISGGTWVVDTAQSAGFIPTTGHAKSPPSLPPGVTFPYGLLDFTLNAGAVGSAATIVITYPAALPAGAVYWKYGPSPAGYNCTGGACAAAHWYQMPPAQAVIAGNTVTLTITDGGVGDDDLAANGVIVDQGGSGVPGGGVAGIPTLSEWGMILLSGLVALFGVAQARRRAGAAT